LFRVIPYAWLYRGTVHCEMRLVFLLFVNCLICFVLQCSTIFVRGMQHGQTSRHSRSQVDSEVSGVQTAISASLAPAAVAPTDASINNVWMHGWPILRDELAYSDHLMWLYTEKIASRWWDFFVRILPAVIQYDVFPTHRRFSARNLRYCSGCRIAYDARKVHAYCFKRLKQAAWNGSPSRDLLYVMR